MTMKPHFFNLVGLLLLTIIVVGCQDKTLYEQGCDLYNNEHYEQAVEVLKKSIVDEGDNYYTRLMLGMSYYSLEKYDDAIDNLLEVSSDDFDEMEDNINYLYCFYLGASFYFVDDDHYDSAATWLKFALDSCSDAMDRRTICQYLGDSYYYMDNDHSREAIKYLEQAISDDNSEKDNQDIYLHIAIAKYLINDSVESYIDLFDENHKTRFENFLGLYSEQNIGPYSEFTSTGSGFFIDPNGYIGTNNHVIEDAKSVFVFLTQGGEKVRYGAKVIKTDPENDVAIIKIIDDEYSPMLQIPYALDNDIKQTGSVVYTLGYPNVWDLGDEVKLTRGVISSKTGYNGDVREYQIDANIHGGNSGGPLFDERGNVIAINTSSYTEDSNIHYSVKVSYLITLAESCETTISLPKESSMDKFNYDILAPYVVLIATK